MPAREGKSWPFDSVVRSEIVYRAWVRGANGKAELFADEIAELQR